MKSYYQQVIINLMSLKGFTNLIHYIFKLTGVMQMIY